AETMATTHLSPFLVRTSSSVVDWWFIRKAASWRLRFRPVDDRRETGTTFIDHLTTELIEAGAIQRWAEVIYEPETHAFGGPTGMAIAHELFHTDSQYVLGHLARTPGGPDYRRELALLLAVRLMRAAGQDWYEQGDMWAHVATHRLQGAPHEPTPASLIAVQQLLTSTGDTPGSPLREAPAWSARFEQAGRALAHLHHCGGLTRGIRAVLTHHLLFTMNRLGISAADQYALAAAASHVVFHQQDLSNVGPCHQINQSERATVTTVTTDTNQTAEANPHQLRLALVERIGKLGAFKSEQVREAFLTVPRERFLPVVDAAMAYAPKPVVTKRAADETAVSSASSPYIVASMLEQLEITPGNKVLEIGAATGINAALIAELSGSEGKVVTIEFDDDLAAGARANLVAAGYDAIEVICGDGAFGHETGAPYDRIIVTAGAWDISTAWWDQLAIGGRIVVPLRLHGSGLTRSIAFDLQNSDRMISTSAVVCGFVPMRGAAEMGERHIRLADDAILKIDTADQPDESALTQALTHPARTQWTGIQIRHDEPVEHLDLWLATSQNGLAFGKVAIGQAAQTLGVAAPALRWSGAALYHGETVIYLVVRPVDDDADELGIVTYGPNTESLSMQVNDLLHQWSKNRPSQPIITAYRTQKPSDELPPSARVLRPDTTLTIGW
ncbi:MAG: methyltransferase, FxLD system, partial [Candidatus Dormibacteraceae bacterium]